MVRHLIIKFIIMRFKIQLDPEIQTSVIREPRDKAPNFDAQNAPMRL